MHASLVIALLAACQGPSLQRPVRAPADHPIRGIDVSHHQGAIDWAEVAGSGEVDFVFIKATEGATHIDRRFQRNLEGAMAVGLPTGVYHYFSLCRTGEQQAQHFIDQVPASALTLGPVVDIEGDGRCNRGARLDRVGDEVSAWVAEVGEHYGVRPLVYTSSAFHRAHLRDASLDADLWVAAYSRRPTTPPWTFWQYTDRAQVPGIRGAVDGNVFEGSLEQWGERQRR